MHALSHSTHCMTLAQAVAHAGVLQAACAAARHLRLHDVDLYETRNIHWFACNLRVAHSSCRAHETAAAGAVPWDASSRGALYPRITAPPKGSLGHGERLQ